MPFIGSNIKAAGISNAVRRSLTSAPSPTSLGTVVAGGGSIVDVNGYRYHFFTSSDTFSVSASGPVEVAIAGGGGGGGDNSGGHAGGGGGAGGLLMGTATFATGNHTVTIGQRGVQGTPGSNGGNSVLGSFTAYGGGYGGSSGGSTAYGGGGGSSGAGGARNGSTPGAPSQNSQSPLTGYGNSGGYANPNNNSGQNAGGGGGGAGSNGQDAINRQAAGGGGRGLSFLVGTTPVTLCSGGGGGAAGYEGHGSKASGGPNAGFGGHGSQEGHPAVPFTGCGGGGAGDGGSGGHGSPGIVICKYKSPSAQPGNLYAKEGLVFDVDAADLLSVHADGVVLNTGTAIPNRINGWSTTVFTGSCVYKHGNGGYFDNGSGTGGIRGSNSDYSVLNNADSITVLGYFTTSNASRQCLMSRFTGSSHDQFNHFADPDGHHWNSSNVGCGSGDIKELYAWSANTWFMSAFVYYGPSLVGVWYVNGQPIHYMKVGDGSMSVPGSGKEISMGARTDGIEKLVGKMAIGRVYARALSQAEIVADFENHRSRFGI